MTIPVDALRAKLDRYYEVDVKRHRLQAAWLRRRYWCTDALRRLRGKAGRFEILNLCRPQAINVGDLAMSLAVAKLCREAGIRCLTLSLDNPVNFDLAPQHGVIIGGGSIVNADVLSAIGTRLRGSPVSLLSVEVFGDPRGKTLPKNLVFSSVRSPRSKARLEQYGARDVELGPDIAWSLSDAAPAGRNRDGRRKVIGLNVTPWPKTYHWQRLQRSDAASRDNQSEETLLRYVEFLSEVVDRFLDAGWIVKFVPFECDDFSFAVSLFGGDQQKKIEILPYCADIKFVKSQLRDCDLFVASRYHAHIFALQSRVPLISVPYSMQVEQLQRLRQMPEELSFPHVRVGELLAGRPGFVLGREEVAETARQATFSFLKAVESMSLHGGQAWRGSSVATLSPAV